MNKWFLFLAVLICTLQARAQYPSYYSFAEQQFKGVDIYDVIQDEHQNYYFATDRGVFVHDGYTFQKITCTEMKGTSVFNFNKDSEGTIYCYNLQRQVFRILNRKIELFYEIPEHQEHFDMSLLITPKDELFIQGFGITIVAKDKSYINELKRSTFSGDIKSLRSNQLPDGTFATISMNKKIAFTSGNDVEYVDYSDDPLFEDIRLTIPFTWINVNDKCYAINRDNLKLYEFDHRSRSYRYLKSLEVDLAGQVLHLYLVNDQIWLTGNSNGTYVFDSEFNPLYSGKKIYASTYISDIFVDHEGNILLSTFDDGVMVISNRNVKGITVPDKQRITKIVSNQNGGLFVGTNRGEIYYFEDNSLKKIYKDSGNKPVESIAYWKHHDRLLFSSHEGLQIMHWKDQQLTPGPVTGGAFKNGYFGAPNESFVALNIGVYRVLCENEEISLERVKGMRKRSYSVLQDPSTKAIYAGISDGLIVLYGDGRLKKVRFQNDYVYPMSMVTDGEYVYVGTRKNGILIFKNDKLIRSIPFEYEARKLVIASNRLFILCNSGLYLSNLDGTNLNRLNKSSGLSFDYVSEFEIDQNTLYVTNSNSLEFINLDYLLNKTYPVPIRFEDILINGEKRTSNSFRHNDRNFEFHFKVATLRFRENITYKYKLKGYDDTWKSLEYSDNKVLYNSLPPGEYTFVVKSMNGDSESKPITYSFTVEAPFYQRWWFFVLITLSSGILIAAFSFFRIRTIRKKNEAKLEKQIMQTNLLETELKALRSQMNPHFIFNSLNSIQDLILQEDTDASYDYIVLFADLVRSTLNYSNTDFIPIDKEIEFLNVYLSLEKLRFKEDFTYNIDYDGSEGIRVPSMLVQPFIENALLHGLLHKEGAKRLTISFKVNDLLECTIEDNGIGREKAKEIKDRQGRGHESFALDAIQKRLSMLNEQLGTSEGQFTFEDLYDGDVAIGTRVHMKIPYQRDF